MISKLGLINSSIRDSFSAAGQYDYNGRLIPKYFQKILDPANIELLKTEMETIPERYLEEYWHEFNPAESILVQWKRQVISQIKANTNQSLTAEIKQEIIESLDEILG